MYRGIKNTEFGWLMPSSVFAALRKAYAFGHLMSADSIIWNDLYMDRVFSADKQLPVICRGGIFVLFKFPLAEYGVLSVRACKNFYCH